MSISFRRLNPLSVYIQIMTEYTTFGDINNKISINKYLSSCKVWVQYK